MRIIKLDEQSKKNISVNLLKRDPGSYGEYEKTVSEIISAVRLRKDDAVFEYTEKFDHISLDSSSIKVKEEDIDKAIKSVDNSLLSVIQKSIDNIRSFHEKQKREGWFTTQSDGIILGQRITPLRRVGVYVPGGKAAYPSTVLMNIIPAAVAGVDEIIMVTPPDKNGNVNPVTLAAASLAGAHTVLKVGGAQAIAALAFGTESVPRVDKIVGPGNIFVALAKKAVYGHVSIDSVAGPSEILVLADDSADPKFIASDLLSQAEHDEMASSILITTSNELAAKVSEYVEALIPGFERKEILRKSIDNYGYILTCTDMEEAIQMVNDIASEHLEIMTSDPFKTMTKIRNAGAIFLGPYSSEPLGDYYAGPNHVLPTNSTARFFSPLSVDDYVKKSSVIYYSEEALEKVHNDIEMFAKSEGLTAHANSIAVRFDKKNRAKRS